MELQELLGAVGFIGLAAGARYWLTRDDREEKKSRHVDINAEYGLDNPHNVQMIGVAKKRTKVTRENLGKKVMADLYIGLLSGFTGKEMATAYGITEGKVYSQARIAHRAICKETVSLGGTEEWDLRRLRRNRQMWVDRCKSCLN